MLDHSTFMDKAKEILYSRIAPGRTFLFYADIVEFEKVNRVYGVERGDQLLASIESYLAGISEVAAHERVFSDQFVFVVVTKEPVSNEDILAVYERRMREFLAAEKSGYPAITLRISCGIYPILDRNVMAAIDGANMARKEAKRRKSTAAVLFDHSILSEQERLRQAEEEIDIALKQGYFTFFLQPKVNLMTGEIIGAEALARRITPEQEIIYPDYFLPIMEDNGRIVELDILIFKKVCAFLSERLDRGLPVVCTSVNLSRLHIVNADTAERLHAIAQEYRVPPSLLDLELTETILLEEFSDAKRLIDELRSYGYRVSIDDFGAGYAGVNIWQQLSFDTLKLDRLFLAEEEPYRTRNKAIVPNVINIAQRLHIEVICEGVENEDQCEYLLRMGCTLAQGFLFSKPVPADELYRTYEEKQGHYFWSGERGCGSEAAPPEADPPVKKKGGLRMPPDFLFPILCAVFLTLCVALTLTIYRNIVTEMFSGSVQHSLESYMDGQAATTRAEISELEGTVKAVAALIEGQRDVEEISGYIDTLNQYVKTPLRFTRAEDYDALIRQEQVQQEWVDTIVTLQKGDVYVSDIAFTCQKRDAYCFSVASPLYIRDQFVGSLRAVVDSDMLVSTEQYTSPYGHVVSSYLSDSYGTLIQTDENESMPVTHIDGILAPYRLPEERAEEIRQAIASDTEAASFLLGEQGGVLNYLTVASLGHNGWNTLVLFHADRAALIIDNLFRKTVAGMGVLMAAILAVCITLALYLRRQRIKRGIDAQRYQLLEQFSDTVLFDYDCKADVIHFTSNAQKLFNLRGLTVKDFVKTLSASNVYPGDYFAVEEALSGRADSVAEFRIRIKHPTEDRYFWCLIQYKYIFEYGQPNSIIGKLVNIDELIRYEEYLIEQSEKDGLTGLFNRTAIELLIQQYLQEDNAGIILMLDVDNFKLINDEYGHDEGDQALRELAKCLKSVFRPEDIIGRVGGDELVIYVRQSSSRTMAQQRAELLLKLLNEQTCGLRAALTLSIGIACYPLDGASYESLFQAADQAMYQAKRLGKNRYCFSRGAD